MARETSRGIPGLLLRPVFWRQPNAREAYRGHPAFERTAVFTDQWDQKAFDPDYDTMPLEAFMPALNRIFTRPAWGAHTKTGMRP